MQKEPRFTVPGAAIAKIPGQDKINVVLTSVTWCGCRKSNIYQTIPPLSFDAGNSIMEFVMNISGCTKDSCGVREMYLHPLPPDEKLGKEEYNEQPIDVVRFIEKPETVE